MLWVFCPIAALCSDDLPHNEIGGCPEEGYCLSILPSTIYLCHHPLHHLLSTVVGQGQLFKADMDSFHFFPEWFYSIVSLLFMYFQHIRFNDSFLIDHRYDKLCSTENQKLPYWLTHLTNCYPVFHAPLFPWPNFSREESTLTVYTLLPFTRLCLLTHSLAPNPSLHWLPFLWDQVQTLYPASRLFVIGCLTSLSSPASSLTCPLCCDPPELSS